ncbi:MAG: serine hydrolase [Syntrophomonadaceae bacterium]
MKNSSSSSKWYVLAALLLLAACFAVIYYFLFQPLTPQTSPVASTWPTREWESCTPEEQGMDSAKLALALQTMRAQDIDIHSLLVIRNGMIVCDAYFYPYDGTVPHDLASVTKSFTTTLAAVAAEQGKLNLDQPVLSFFPDRTIANRDDRKERATVRSLAGMVSGFECMGFAQDEGTLDAMRNSSDWLKYALDRPMEREPGTQFVYDSPGMHLISGVLQQATGMSLLEYARQNLFEPLGIKEVIWPADPQGYNHGWGDLHLLPRDAAKLGYLWQNGGLWEGRQLVPGDWVENSVKLQIKTGGEDDYGFGWWVIDGDLGPEYAAIGRGGQRIHVLPSLSLIIVTTGGGFDINEIWPSLSPVLVDPQKPLPANDAGAVQLQAALAEIKKAPESQAIAPLPAMARVISGKNYVLDANPMGLERVRLEFDGSDQAVLHISYSDKRISPPQPIGLDGVYRLIPGDYGLPQGGRGYWLDEDTFIFEQDRIANFDHNIFDVTFQGERIIIKGHKADHELGIDLNGRMED